jgi:hypothetical protein
MDWFFIKIHTLRNIFHNIHASSRQFAFSLQPNNVFLQFWQMFLSKRIWWTMSVLQLTLFTVQAGGNFKGRFSGTYIYMEKVNVLFVILLCHYQRHKHQYYNWAYCTNMYIIPVWKKKHFFFLHGFHNLYFVFPLSTWDYRKYTLLLLKANISRFCV